MSIQRSALWLLVAAGLFAVNAARSNATEVIDLASRTVAGPAFVVDPVGEPKSVGSSPNDFVAAGGWVYFTATTPSTGRELWRTDCTAEGTTMVDEIAPAEQPNSSSIRLTAVNDLVFFEPSQTTDIWRSGGTGESTFQLTKGAGVFSPVFEVNGTAIFFGFTGGYDQDLWRSDGTVGGTYKLAQFFRFQPDSKSRLLVAGDVGYFEALDSEFDSTLWRTDGTTEGTVPLPAPFPGPSTTWRVVPLEVIGSLLFFTTTPQNGRPQLWVYDEDLHQNRSLGTNFVAPTVATRLGNILLFAADDAAHGMELWRSDGTAAGTYIVSDLVPGPASSSVDWEPNRLGRVLSDVLVFAANGPRGNRIMWRSDGTAAGTAPIDASTSAPTIVRLGQIFEDALYVQAEDEVSGSELWKVTPSAIELVRDVRPGNGGSAPVVLIAVDDLLYFLANSSGADGVELWRTDGSMEGTVLVSDTRFTPAAEPPPIGRCAHGFAFRMDDELGFFDGSVLHRKNIATDMSASTPSILAKAGNTIVFRSDDEVRLADSQASVRSLRIDATEAAIWNHRIYLNAKTLEYGTELVAATFAGDVAIVSDIVRGVTGSFPRQLTASRNGVFFAVGDRYFTDGDLWFSDGTTTGTRLIPLQGRGFPSGLTNLDDKVYFGFGGELWRSDGTTSGTQKMALESALNHPGPMTFFDDHLFFAANRSYLDTSLRRVGPLGTATIAPVAPQNLVAVDNFLYFSGSNGDTTGNELWRSDGTTAGTHLVRDINSEPSLPRQQPSSSFPSDFVGINGDVLFVADDGVHGRELWRTNGAAAGTFLVQDIRPGARGSNPAELMQIGDRVVFTADGAEGRELWETDGTSDGTRLLADLLPGNQPSNPRQLTLTRSHLYFTAYDTNSTRQLWAVPLATVCGGDCDDSGGVTVDELVLLTNIALGDGDVDECRAGDFDGDATITVDEILTATASALDDCIQQTRNRTARP